MAIEDVTGKRLWLRAKDLGAGGSSVTSWADQSGHHNDAKPGSGTPTVQASATPLGGKAVRFTNTYMAVPRLGTPARVRGAVSCRASSTFNGVQYNPENAIDGNISGAILTTWASASLPAWWLIELATAETLTSYRLNPGSQYPIAWTFEGSNDGASWTTLDTRSGQTLTEGSWSSSYTFTNTTAYTFYRINVTSASGGSIVHLREIELGGVSNTASHGAGEAWMVVRVNTAAGTANSGPWNFGAIAFGDWFPFSDGNVYEQTGLATRTSFAPSLTLNSQWRIYRITSNGSTSWQALLDNVSQKLLSGSAAAPQWFTNAAGIALGLDPSNGSACQLDIAEVLTFDQQLSSGDAATVYDYLVAEHISATVTVTGTIAGMSPAGAGSLAGTVDNTTTGTLAGASPVGTGSLTGTAPTTGTIAGTSPAGVGALDGTTDNTTTGTIAGTSPAGAGTLDGIVPIVGDLAGTSPAPVGSITGDVITPPADGTLAGTSPAGVGGLTGNVGGIAPGWTTELTGRALIGIDTTTTDLYVPPAPAAIPGPVSPRMLHRNSQVMAAPTAATPVIADTDVTVITSYLGIPRVWVDGVDRTYTDDGELLDLDDLASSVGLGDLSATATVKGAQVWDPDGSGTYSWLYPGAQVEAGVVHPDTGARVTWWAGTLLNPSGDLSGSSFRKTWEAAGPLTQLARANMQPLDSMPPTDIGIVIPRVVNQVISRDYPPMPQVRTGITTTKRGTYGQKVAEYVREVLATAWVGNRQWRPARDPNNPRQYRLVLTDTTTVHWTLTAGAIGVKPQLGRDWSQNENAIYGRGTLTGGHRWMNRKYPYLLPYDPPAYFNVDPDAALHLGSTDADTRNNGVSLLQRRLQELGYKVTVTGVYDTQTRAAVIRLQRKRGLLVDGITAGQTWTSVWSIGATGADLRSVRLPLATDPRVEPWLYLPNGSIAEPNPAYVRSWPRVEADMEYGENTTLELGIDDALQRVDRALTAPLMGTITLTTCPWEGSRWEMEQGHNVLLKGWEGADVLLHIVDVKRNRRAGTVTVTVDEAFRDALTVHQVMVRNAESKPDPAARPGVIGRSRGTSAPDMTTPYDGESAAGKLPELTIRGGLWSVWPVALDEVGTLARAFLKTYTPGCRFAVLLFGQPILPSQLVAGVGNVLAKNRPWADDNVDQWLTDHGFIEGWGHQGQACGFGRGQEDKGDPVKGWSEFRVGVQYKTTQPPFIHLAVLAEANCHFTGELDPEPKV